MERKILRGLLYVVLLLASFVYVVDGFSGRDVASAGYIALAAFMALTISAPPPVASSVPPAKLAAAPPAVEPDRSGSRPPRTAPRTG